MTDDDNLAGDRPEQVPESLQTLAGYLERSLDGASSVVMMRHTTDVCTVYLGDPDGPREDLKQIGAISTALANRMLESTSSGVNAMQIGGQAYRFARSFTEVAGMAAVVFSTE
ncbi:hypothetical protein [Paraburkholderia podalyriae]|uniref:Roadblock/LAMTOR2 domain-containing protein n=1 Tax=Paraburkholderia podalyriae TaxID=1938811 RepID=A0ABR7Q2Y8_9BURK|nr:hypothetical protein [Paraburkholderia podalyriae]MBC8752781.1 hypothetical protein [Paraburkholderia podalyriae]